MTDLIDRQAAIDALDCINGVEEVLKALPPALQKPLKYTGESICLYCWTVNCDGCMYEPVMEVKR